MVSAVLAAFLLFLPLLISPQQLLRYVDTLSIFVASLIVIVSLYLTLRMKLDSFFKEWDSVNGQSIGTLGASSSHFSTDSSWSKFIVTWENRGRLWSQDLARLNSNQALVEMKLASLLRDSEKASELIITALKELTNANMARTRVEGKDSD